MTVSEAPSVHGDDGLNFLFGERVAQTHTGRHDACRRCKSAYVQKISSTGRPSAIGDKHIAQSMKQWQGLSPFAKEKSKAAA